MISIKMFDNLMTKTSHWGIIWEIMNEELINPYEKATKN